MRNRRAEIEIVQNMPELMSYPVALMTENGDISWLNGQAEKMFEGQSVKNISDCIDGFNMAEMRKLTVKGASYCITDKQGETVYFRDMPYDTESILLAVWTGERSELWKIQQQNMMAQLSVDYLRRTAMHRAFLILEEVEDELNRQKKDKLSQRLDDAEREIYTLYRLLEDQAILHDSRLPELNGVVKFDVTAETKALIGPIRLVAQSLQGEVCFDDRTKQPRYAVANPEWYVFSVLKLVRVMLMFAEDKILAVTFENKSQETVLTIAGKSRSLLGYLEETASELSLMQRVGSMEKIAHAYEYTSAEKIVRQNHMRLTKTENGDELTLTLSMCSTDDPNGYLRSDKKVYLGNRFSTLSMVFGDLF